MTWANRSRSLFCYEQPEQIAHSRSFVQSNLSKLLTVALLFRATWGICSRSLFKKETATERRATGAIWFLALKGGKLQKPLEKMIFFNFFEGITCFWEWQERPEWFSHRRFVMRDLSKSQIAYERKSEFPTLSHVCQKQFLITLIVEILCCRCKQIHV